MRNTLTKKVQAPGRRLFHSVISARTWLSWPNSILITDSDTSVSPVAWRVFGFKNLNTSSFLISMSPHTLRLFPSFFCSDLRSDAVLIWVWPERGMDSLGRIYWGPSESQLTLHSNGAITWQFVSVCVCVCLEDLISCATCSLSCEVQSILWHFEIREPRNWQLVLWVEKMIKSQTIVLNCGRASVCVRARGFSIVFYLRAVSWIVKGVYYCPLARQCPHPPHMENGGLELRLKGWLH